MIEQVLEQLFKLLNGKNISFGVLLVITVLSGYFVFNVVKSVLEDNKNLIKSIHEIDMRLREISDLIKNHEEHESDRRRK